MSQESAFEFCQVSKFFGSVVANNSVSFAVPQGTIHGVVGENGAGKSTIMKILYGLYEPDSGHINLKGKKVAFQTPQHAIAKGIGMVHQHFMLVPTLTVWQNIVLGQEPRLFGLVGKQVLPELEKIKQEYGFQVDLRARIDTLPVGQQQQVEIFKLLYRQASVLILDEPTAVLTPQEVELLLNRLQHLKALGKTIVFISHKLKEILNFTENVTVMRQGAVVGTYPTKELTKETLSEKMIGRRLKPLPQRKVVDRTQKARLEISHLSVIEKEQTLLKNISLKVFPGEILGIAGVDGNGQNELTQILMNTARSYSGECLLDGKPFHSEDTYKMKQQGFAVIPPDRLKEAVVTNFSVRENFIFGHHHEKKILRYGCFNNALIKDQVQQAIQEFDIRPKETDWPMSGLSGGNQQKVVLAREFSNPVRFLVAAQPTRGVDVGAIEFIYSQFMKLKGLGAAIVLISTELDEILELSDRIVVLYEGKIQGECNRENADEKTLGLWMTGAKA